MQPPVPLAPGDFIAVCEKCHWTPGVNTAVKPPCPECGGNLRVLSELKVTNRDYIDKDYDRAFKHALKSCLEAYFQPGVDLYKSKP